MARLLLDTVAELRPDLADEVRKMGRLEVSYDKISRYLEKCGVTASRECVRSWLFAQGIRKPVREEFSS